MVTIVIGGERRVSVCTHAADCYSAVVGALEAVNEAKVRSGLLKRRSHTARMDTRKRGGR